MEGNCGMAILMGLFVCSLFVLSEPGGLVGGSIFTKGFEQNL